MKIWIRYLSLRVLIFRIRDENVRFGSTFFFSFCRVHVGFWIDFLKENFWMQNCRSKLALSTWEKRPCNIFFFFFFRIVYSNQNIVGHHSFLYVQKTTEWNLLRNDCLTLYLFTLNITINKNTECLNIKPNHNDWIRYILILVRQFFLYHYLMVTRALKNEFAFSSSSKFQ